MIGRLLSEYDFADMTLLPEIGEHAVGKPGMFYCVYLPHGGAVTLHGLERALPFRWVNPRTGATCGEGIVQPAYPTLTAQGNDVVVLLAGYRRTRS